MDRRRMMATVLSGGVDDTFAIYTDAVTPATFDPSWTFSVGGGPMTVDWGDGSAPESHATGLSHTYASAGRKRAVFTCPDWTKLTIFDCSTDVCRQDLPALALEKCTGLIEFYAQSNQFTGRIPRFSNPNMTQIWLLNNLVSGTIPDLSGLTKLIKFWLAGSQVSGYVPGTFATQKSLNNCSIAPNLLPQSAIDNILSDLVTSLSISGRVIGGTALYGPNTFTPSPSGWADITTLKTAGWSVYANVEMGIIGDSISVGGGAGWPDYLKTAYLSLGGDAMVVNNHAVFGNTIIGNMDAQCIEAANDANSHMILALGTNDDNAGNMATLQAKVEENIVRLKASNTGVKLYYMNVLPRWTADGTAEIDKANIRTAIAAACTAQSITCWDTYTTPWITYAQTDGGTHPDLAGKNAIRDQVLLRIPTATLIGA